MKFLLAVTAFVIGQSAMAQTFDYSKRWGLGGSFGYNTPIFGNIINEMADGDISWGVHGRYHFNQQDGIELGHSRYELSDINNLVKSTDVLYFRRLNGTSRFTPILGAGAGIIEISRYNPGTPKLGLKARAGAEYAINECFSLGLNVDYQHVNKMLFAANLPTRNAHLLSARVGLTYYFGGADKKSEAAPVAPVAAAKIDRDTDGDGILDSKDKCPNTPKGTTVNAYGCAVEEKATVNIDVKFDSGKSTISSEFNDDLSHLVQFMKEHPKTKIEIQGHTDSSGSKTLNKNLSIARASSVKDYLVKRLGADASRLTSNGYGDEMPVAENNTAEGRQQNRRVVAVITE